MNIEPFEMERMQSTYEKVVDCDLSESGVHPMTVRELLAPERIEALLQERLVYSQTNGTPELRALVAAMHPGATEAHVEITNGGAEANFIATWGLLERGDEVVFLTPSYMQIWGLVRGFGAHVREWPLRLEHGRWHADLELLRDLVGARTRLIVLTNPNNPTGARIPEADLDEIARVASAHGAWILADEIYRGAERDGEETATMWGRYERVLITGGLSKAYGLPGLRIGWIVAPPAVVASSWAHHDYTTIAPSTMGDYLAREALHPEVRPRILRRTRGAIRENYEIVASWLEQRAIRTEHVPPEAGAIVFLRYGADVGSLDLVTRLREEQSVLVVPGAHFHMDGWLRIGFGPEPHRLREGLRRTAVVLDSLARC